MIRKINEKKDNKRNQIFLGLILVGVMLFSILGYSFRGAIGRNSGSNYIEYNSFKFIKNGEYWIVNEKGVDLFVRYNPKEIPESNFFGKEDYYKNAPLYISSESKDAGYEITKNLQGIAQRIQFACLEGEECSNENFPVKTCSDNFIFIKNGVKGIRQEENCVFIEGNETELVQMSDEFLFQIFGIR